MSEPQPHRRIELTFSGPGIRNDRVPVSVFIGKLDSLQKVVLSLARSALGKRVGRRGPLPGDWQKQFELYLIETRAGESMTAAVTTSQEQEGLFDDLPEVVVLSVPEAVKAVADRDSQTLRRLAPDPVYRRRLVRDTAELCPSADENYRVTVRVPGLPFVEAPTRPSREDQTELVGEAAQEIPEEGVKALIDAKCWAELAADGNVHILDVLDFTYLEGSLELSLQEVGVGGRTFRFKREIRVNLRIEDGHYLMSYEPLGILAYGRTRQAVRKSFAQEVALLWDEYADAPDEGLTPGAQILKRDLKELVEPG